jgi:hypothetical protein
MLQRGGQQRLRQKGGISKNHVALLLPVNECTLPMSKHL